MKTVKIFSTVENYELMKILDALKPMEFSADSQIIKEVCLKSFSGVSFTKKWCEPSCREMKETYSSSF